tara:strand:+ start:944 stop:1144 length:201 start_codon:yes stop_codon:yes gene_type:complete
MSKKTKFKVGDIVRSNEHIGIWEVVWYKTGDDTCAIQNNDTRALVKVNRLSLVMEDESGLEIIEIK